MTGLCASELSLTKIVSSFAGQTFMYLNRASFNSSLLRVLQNADGLYGRLHSTTVSASRRFDAVLSSL